MTYRCCEVIMYTCLIHYEHQCNWLTTAVKRLAFAFSSVSSSMHKYNRKGTTFQLKAITFCCTTAFILNFQCTYIILPCTSTLLFQQACLYLSKICLFLKIITNQLVLQKKNVQLFKCYSSNGYFHEVCSNVMGRAIQ